MQPALRAQAIEGGGNPAVEPQDVQTQDAESHQRRRRLRMEGAHRIVREHAGKSLSCPAGAMQSEERLQQLAEAAQIRGLEAQLSGGLGPAAIVAKLAAPGLRQAVLKRVRAGGQAQDRAGLERHPLVGEPGRVGLEQR
jgi:hypothetical protein